MVAALGAELVSRGRAPSPLDLPADSSQPVTQVCVTLAGLSPGSGEVIAGRS